MAKLADKIIISLSQLEFVRNSSNKAIAVELVEAINELKKRRLIISDNDRIQTLIFLESVFDKFPDQIKNDPKLTSLVELYLQMFKELAPIPTQKPSRKNNS